MSRLQEESETKGKHIGPLQNFIHDLSSKLHQAIRCANYADINFELANGEILCSGDGLNCFFVAHQTGNWKLVKKLLEHDPCGAVSQGPDREPLFSLYPQHLSSTSSDYAKCLLQVVKNKSSPDLVQKVIDLFGMSLEEKDGEGKTALMHALSDMEVARKLVSAGADVTAKDSQGTTVLMHAILQSTPVDFVDSLIKLGADVSVQNNNESRDTALLVACQKGDPEVVQLLLNSGANVSLLNNYRESPLMVATQHAYPEIMKILLAAGAEVNVKNWQGETALFKVQNEECLLLLLQSGIDVMEQTQNGNTAVMHYLLSRNPELCDCIKLALEAGVYSSVYNIDDNTPLMEACNQSSCQYLEVIKLLLPKGVNPSGQNKRGFSALSFAIIWRRIETINFLISIGANPSSQDINGTSLLMHVCQSDDENMEIANLLIQAGANVSAENKRGQTACTIAAERGHTNLMKRLLEAGAVHSPSNTTSSILLKTCFSSDEYVDLVSSFKEDGVDVSLRDDKSIATPLMIALEGKHYNIVDLLLKHGANVCAQDKDGRNALMVACVSIEKNIDIVKLLLKYDVNLSASDGNGHTALKLAFIQKKYDVVKFLIEAGANVSTQDKRGNTLLMGACTRKQIDIIKLLLNAGACVSVQNNKGETAAIIAASTNQLDIVCLLLEAGASSVTRDNNESSTISHVFANRIRGEIHTDFDKTLKTLIDYGVKNDSFSIVPEVVQVYLSNCSSHQMKNRCSALFKQFTKQIIETVSDKLKELNLSYVPHQSEIFHSVMQFAEHLCYNRMNEITDLIVQSPFKNVSWTDKEMVKHSYFTGGFCSDMLAASRECHGYGCETFGNLILSYDRRYRSWDLNSGEEMFHDLRISLPILLNNGFSLNFKNPNVMSPLSILMNISIDSPNEKHNISKLAKELIDLGVSKCQRLLRFKEDYFIDLKQELQLPDAVWVAFINGYSSIVPLLLPYWSAPPLALLMFLPDPENHNALCYRRFSIAMKVFDILLEIGGPLPPGHKFIRPIQMCLETLLDEGVKGNDWSEKFRSFHNDAPPSLMHMCRHVIRGCVQTGDDLPDRLSQLVPHGLKSYICMMN